MSGFYLGVAARCRRDTTVFSRKARLGTGTLVPTPMMPTQATRQDRTGPNRLAEAGTLGPGRGERHGPNVGMTRHTVDPRDHQLRTAVAAELDWAPEVAADSIGVAVNRGTVILSGEVGTYLEKSAAVKAALRVRGVTAVADEITARLSSVW